MEEKGLWPFIFLAGMAASVGVIKAKRFVQPAMKNTRVFLIEQKEHLEDIFARTKAKRHKAKRH